MITNLQENHLGCQLFNWDAKHEIAEEKANLRKVPADIPGPKRGEGTQPATDVRSGIRLFATLFMTSVLARPGTHRLSAIFPTASGVPVSP
jgi:hypothetical protein